MWVIKKFMFAVVMFLLSWTVIAASLFVVSCLIAVLGIPYTALIGATAFGIICLLV